MSTGFPQNVFGAYFSRYWHKKTANVVSLKYPKAIQLLIFLDFNLFLKFYMGLLWWSLLKLDVCFIIKCTQCVNNIIHKLYRYTTLYMQYFIFYRNHTFFSRKFCLVSFHCNSISDWKRKCICFAGKHN